MLSDLKEMVESLEKSSIFKKWKENHKQAFLSGFFIVDEQGWQLAYYSPENDRVSTFLKDRLIQSDSAIFKLKQARVEELDLEKVKISPGEAFNIADKVLEEKHPGYKPVKKIK
jgi:GTP-sensing pleiotropic transcriptional regulator CodY